MFIILMIHYKKNICCNEKLMTITSESLQKDSILIIQGLRGISKIVFHGNKKKKKKSTQEKKKKKKGKRYEQVA
jgi:hypothetical protein